MIASQTSRVLDNIPMLWSVFKIFSSVSQILRCVSGTQLPIFLGNRPRCFRPGAFFPLYSCSFFPVNSIVDILVLENYPPAVD